jgi:hypothetical protein
MLSRQAAVQDCPVPRKEGAREAPGGYNTLVASRPIGAAGAVPFP